MKRKLIKQGSGGFTIYLPKKWVDSKGLGEGGEVTINELDTSLVISSEVKTKKHGSIEMKADNKDQFKNILTHYYRRGYDVVEIKNIDEEDMKVIRDLINDFLLGFEITDFRSSSCIIENISEPSGEKYDVILRRIFLLIQEMIEIIADMYEKGIHEGSFRVDQTITKADKFILFCRRLVIKEKEQRNPVLHWELLTFLMHIVHSLKYLHKYLKDEKNMKPDQRIVGLFKELQDYYQLFYDAYFSQNVDNIYKLDSLKWKYQFGECHDLLKMDLENNDVVVSYQRELFRLIQIGASPMLSMFTTQ